MEQRFGTGPIVKLADGELIDSPERAEQLGLTADARRMRRERQQIEELKDALPKPRADYLP